MDLFKIADGQVTALKSLRFGPPVTHVYNPLEYARRSHDFLCAAADSRDPEALANAGRCIRSQ